MPPPVVLDLDGSAGAPPGAQVLPLRDWQEPLRFGCSRALLRRFAETVLPSLPADPGTVFTGSGDFHHLTLPLVERLGAVRRARGDSAPIDVIVFDNHPDNMRFPFGIHCGSWVRDVARLPFVRQVRVLGITSGDVSWAHAWENHWQPLARGRLRYDCVGVDIGWAAWVGLGHAFRRFDSVGELIDRFVAEQSGRANATDGETGVSAPVYLSIDKDVLDPQEVRTNWDQGRMRSAELLRAIDALRGRIVGSDVTGDVSQHRYATAWKRWLSAVDAQPTIFDAQLAAWRGPQQALNAVLAARIAAAG